MQVTEDLARYIIGLQRYKDAEVGEDDNDQGRRADLERAFPVLRHERMDSEFNDWLWTVRLEADDRVEDVRARLQLVERPVGDYTEAQWRDYMGRYSALTHELHVTKWVVAHELGIDDCRAEWDALRRIR